MLLYLLLYIASSLLITSWAQAPAIQWQKALGGTAEDVPQSIYGTADGGFIVGGATGSNDGDVSGNHGGGDLWIAKLYSTGAIQWKKTLGGAGQEKGALIQPTSDGGYIVGGTTASSKGDVVGYKGGGDIWVVKLSGSGAIQWQKCLGGRSSDEIVALQEVIINNASQGFIVGGNTSSTNGDVSGHHGGIDAWVVRLSQTGAIQWQRALGSSGEETLNELGLTPDGGFIVGSRTSTNGGDVSGVHGSVDLWIVKLNNSGGVVWKRTLGGSGLENFAAVKPTNDGGCIVGTNTDSNDGDVRDFSTASCIWIVKLTSAGAISWQKKYFENGSSSYKSVRQSRDGSYIVSGMGQDNSTITSGGILVSKLNADGTEAWRKEFGIGSEGAYYNNEPYTMQQTADAGYVLAGANSKKTSSDIGHWMLKLDADGNKKWDRVYGGSGEDWYWAGCCGATTLGGYIYFSSLLPYMKLQSSDGGYYFAVATKSRDGDVTGLHYSPRMGLRADMWVVKLHPDGMTASGSMAAVTEEEVTNISKEVSAYPNPFSAQTTIRFTATENGKATVELYNIIGAKIGTLFNSDVKAGEEYKVRISDMKLAKGTYLYFIQNNQSRMSGRLIKNQ
ncbi:T9SS type A sorting domain-containing protein [Pontibacter toksunensis]|uniref:T9SS type A sorting domain-containing protein n=1 Tax=Pontibacter toksunensis TaxID=1332631 RepID=A0ABW6C189_9BACT